MSDLVEASSFVLAEIETDAAVDHAELTVQVRKSFIPKYIMKFIDRTG